MSLQFHVRKDGEVLRRKVEAKMKMKKEEIDEEGNTEGHGSVYGVNLRAFE